MTRYPPSASTSVASPNVQSLADRGAHITEAEADRQERAVTLARDRRNFRLVVLVGDVADDQLDQILDRDETVATAIFVDNQRQVNARRLHLASRSSAGIDGGA